MSDARVAEIKTSADSTIALELEMLIFQHYMKFWFQSMKNSCEGGVKSIT